MSQFDSVGFCIAWEQGELDESETAEGFQHLIDSGLAWQLQGCYGRTAAALIEADLCHVPGQQQTTCRSGQCGN